MARTLYRDLFGERFEALPAEIKAMHGAARKAAGRGDIQRGRSVLAQLLCALSGAPHSGRDVPVEVRFDPLPGGECWTRDFDGETFRTRLMLKQDGAAPALTEHFGPFAFHLRMRAHDEGVNLVPEGVKLFGAPLPRFLCPEAGGYERVREGRFCFEVFVRFPLAGEIVRYEGWLKPVA